MKSQLTVTDNAGNSHAVLAAKRIDSFRLLVIRVSPVRATEFVVHTFNVQDGGFHNGHYCDTLTRAFEVFNADRRAEGRTLAEMHADEVARRGGTVRDRVARTYALTHG